MLVQRAASGLVPMSTDTSLPVGMVDADQPQPRLLLRLMNQRKSGLFYRHRCHGGSTEKALL
jgi:hypothetical protein